MNWLDRLERKYSKYAIRNLMYGIIIIQLMGLVLITLIPDTIALISLNPDAILKGQVWRLVTFLAIPPTTNLLFAALVLYFYYMIGSTLESYWGTFRFNLFYLLGILATIVSAFVLRSFGYNFNMDPTYINLSLFLVFATLFPDFELLLFFILPIKIKYLAFIEVLLLIYSLTIQPLPIKIQILIAMGNYLLFFASKLFKQEKTFVRKQKYRKKLNQPKKFHHKCTICGKTEKDDESLEFRFCSKCDGHYEYCSNHLFTHEHIKQNNENK